MKYIHRDTHSKNYTVLSNHIIQNSDLTLAASGLLAKMLSLPDHWRFNLNHLASLAKSGTRAVWSALKELEARGYVCKYAIRDSLGRFKEWITEVYETPREAPKGKNSEASNPDQQSILSSLQNPNFGVSKIGKQHPLESNKDRNQPKDKLLIPPPTPSPPSEAVGEVGEEKSFLGIKSNPNTLSTMQAMLEPLQTAIASVKDQASGDGAVEKSHISPIQEPTAKSPLDANSVLRKLSQITGETIETLRTNSGLQKALKSYSKNLEATLDYLESESKSHHIGVGFVVMSLREGRKREKAGGSSWKKWADKAKAEGVFDYSMSQGNDILVVFKNGKNAMWSELQTLAWVDVLALAGG